MILVRSASVVLVAALLLAQEANSHPRDVQTPRARVNKSPTDPLSELRLAQYNFARRFNALNRDDRFDYDCPDPRRYVPKPGQSWCAGAKGEPQWAPTLGKQDPALVEARNRFHTDQGTNSQRLLAAHADLRKLAAEVQVKGEAWRAYVKAHPEMGGSIGSR